MDFRNFSRHCQALLVAVSVLTRTASALGDPVASDRDTARVLMDEGFSYRDRGNLKGALQSFTAADEIMHVPTTRLEVARSQADLGLLVEALDTAISVSRIPVPPNEPRAFAVARAQAQELANKFEKRLASLSIVITDAKGRTGLSVFIDASEVPVDALAVPRRMNPGHHAVTMVLGSRQQRAELDLAEGEAKGLRLDAGALFDLAANDPKATAPPPPAISEPSYQAPSPAPRTHTPEKRNHFGALTIGGLALGGAGLAVGTIFGIRTFSIKASLHCPNGVCPPDQHADLKAARDSALVANIGFAAAGVGAAAAALGYFVGIGASEPRVGSRITPVVGYRHLGVMGHF